MHTMFKSPEKSEKKSRRNLIEQTNQKISDTFNHAFSEIYLKAREQLLLKGVSEEDVDDVLSEIKLELQREMILKAKEGIEKTVISVAKETQTQSRSGSDFCEARK